MISVIDRRNNVLMECLASHESVDEVAPRPFFWHSMAEHLAAAADLLWEHVVIGNGARPPEYRPRVLRPAVLMLALAFENTLKGLAAAQGNARVANGTLKWQGGGHNLSALAQLARETPSDDERLWLDCLQEAILWWGRYPSDRRMQAGNCGTADRCLDWERAREYLGRLIERLSDPRYMVM